MRRYVQGASVLIFVAMAITFLLKMSVIYSNHESGIKVALEQVRKDFAYEDIMWQPTTSKREGSNFKKENGVLRILYDGCLSGEITKSEVGENYEKNFILNNLAELTGNVLDHVGLGFSVDGGIEAQLKLSGLYSRRISNIYPTFDDACAAVDFFPNDPVFQEVLYAEEFRIRVKLSLEETQKIDTKNGMTGVGGIEFDVEHVSDNGSKIEFVAKNVALSYKKAQPNLSRKDFRAACTKNIRCKFGDSGYSVVVKEMDNSGIAVIIDNELLGLNSIEVKLPFAENKSFSEKPAARNYISAGNYDIDRGTVDLQILAIKWSFEKGNRVVKLQDSEEIQPVFEAQGDDNG